MKKTEKESLRKIIRSLHQAGKSQRQIARSLNIHRDTVRKLLQVPAPLIISSPLPALPGKQRASKIDPFRERIKELIEIKKITNREIYRRLRKEGYRGGKTILGDFLQKLRGSRQSRRAFIRYEPAPGYEAQSDWSPYHVILGGVKCLVHVFSLILSYSRYQYLEVFLNEQQDTLFAGHIEAFRYFHGIPALILYDNQSPVTTGRVRGIAFFHQRFLSFANHYGFRPRLCLPYDKERKGRVERPFGYLATSFFPGRTFDSLEDLRDQLRRWMEDEEEATGNYRIHGTTRRRPVDMWQEERDLLIELPVIDFLPTRIEERLVGKDCLISVLGNYYTVPPKYVGRRVTVVISPRGIKVYNRRRDEIAMHIIPAGKGRMIIDEKHYDELRRRNRYLSTGQSENRFDLLFPLRQSFLSGLKMRVKSIYPIHLKLLDKLLEHFTRRQVDQAIKEASQHGVFTVTYVEEILKRHYPAQISLRRFDKDGAKPRGLNLGPLDPGDAEGFDQIFEEGENQTEKGGSNG